MNLKIQHEGLWPIQEGWDGLGMEDLHVVILDDNIKMDLRVI